MSQLNSQQFMRMIADGEAEDFLSGEFYFNTLGSGLSVHGGRFTAKRDVRLSRLVPPYVSFIVLLEGGLDFSLNQHRYVMEAEGGKVLLIAGARESLFCRYLHAGQMTRKLTLKGLDFWLAQGGDARYLNALYRETVRSWPLDASIARLAHACLASGLGGAEDAVARLMQREIDALRLLAALWQDYGARFPLLCDEAVILPSEGAFLARLDAVFAQGARQTRELAAALCMSERTLQRRLQAHLNVTAGEWLRHKQMQYALQALTTGQASIGEIAWGCGYRRSSAFIQAFKRYFGCTPARLREQGGVLG